ncbi:uncharacterized protein LOC106647539 [Copidosoma floridanum]|uniref:uncharacterized protein LOC106647539 n=1 Tax=Copidosoma floridanum TaxID=29053 RepID=UPI0006C97ED3|nr:uncharacterized protein LOC106647539 [Copidosoma floridanum]
MEDDYSTVYSWVDKSGIISNIRTHLRRNLVNALKNRDLAQRFVNATPKSAKQYIYDLLIAEYLWNHNYVCTLSVFASEAPLLVNFNKHIRTSNEQDDSITGHKLQNDYVHHTLETLGIEPTKAKGQSIIKNYADNDMPLLLCILQYIKTTEYKCYSSDEQQSNVKDTRGIGVQTTETGETIINKLTKIAIAKKKLLHQKNLFDAQLKQKEIELREQAALMEKQLLLLQEKLEHAQKLMYVCDQKEKQLNEEKRQEQLRISQKENELAVKEKLLLQEANRLDKERDSYRQFEGNLKKLQDELTKAQHEVTHNKVQNLNLNVNNVQVQTDFESFVLAHNERNLLSQEKQDLNGLVQAQQARIEQLTSRVVHLSRKLEETQLKSTRNIELPSPCIKLLNTNTVISESSSTEDIIQDAKNRLRRLEEESMRADQYYLNFINNSSH